MKTVKLVWLGNGRQVATDNYMVVKYELDGFFVSKCIQITDDKLAELKDQVNEDIEVPTNAL
jgi:hypothetical protein